MAQEPDLKTLIKRLERRNAKKQAATALVAASLVLGLAVITTPYFSKEKSQPITEAPAIQKSAQTVNAYADISLTGKAAIVYDLKTGETLFAVNENKQLPLASLTKLLTMYAAADSLSSTSVVTITESALLADGESGFVAGERFAFKDIARLALVASSNDATEAIAETAEERRNLSGQNLLAGAAAAAGLSQTYAYNGTGLDESTSVSGGYGSAQDVAKLAGALLAKAPEIAHATIESSFTIQSLDGVVHTLPNTNPDVVRIPGVMLSKTGFTDLAGGNLAVVYDAGIDHPIAIVVLGSTIDGRFTDVQRLLTRTEAHFANTQP
ncbi:MAG: hypothetical protein JWN64_144 [Parcubacteria group bacterium]|nr:hypothetical protein [Parcubacteria group bacterium]